MYKLATITVQPRAVTTSSLSPPTFPKHMKLLIAVENQRNMCANNQSASGTTGRIASMNLPVSYAHGQSKGEGIALIKSRERNTLALLDYVCVCVCVCVRVCVDEKSLSVHRG